jgi:hypothetical protein
MTKISNEEQLKAVIYVKETFDNYVPLNESHRNEMLDIYKEYRSFKQDRKNDWSS